MKESIFSFFNAPITNQVPNGVVCVSQLYAYITTSEWLRERTDQVRAASSDEKRFRRLKQSLLPYVTPAGIFSYRKEDHLLVRPDLAFISPSNTGVKLFVPYRLSVTATIEWAFDEARRSAWEYLEWKYGLKADATNADLSRACFLCHDPSARLGDRNC